MKTVFSTLAIAALATSSFAGDWPAWRGPQGNSVSTETDLISSWSPKGENLLWRVDWIGRSTPVVFDGRVCVNGRIGEDQTRQEVIACFDAASGAKLWEYRFHVVHSTVPWTRVGWANPTIDPETGWLYIQGVGGEFVVLDRDGAVQWRKNLMEEYGFMEGYGGRTQTPVIDEDRLILTYANNSWGDQRIPRHRLFAFDKRTGEMLWASSPAPDMADKNSQSTPALLFANGRRLLVHGNGSGDIFAVDSHTGEHVWTFELSQRAMNSSVTVEGTTVYAVHGEENVDEATMGRAVAIDGTGVGNITKTHELWRAHLESGFTSPLAFGGRVYITTISGELTALDATDGRVLWGVKIGRIGRGGSPVWADGRIYATEVNGTVAIVEPGESEGKLLSRVQLRMPERRPAELWGSVAIANGRIYFTTEEGLYCLGKPDAAASATPPGPPTSKPGEGAPAVLASYPAETRLATDGSASFRVAAFDSLRRPLPTAPAVTWSLAGLVGEIDAQGTFRPDPKAGAQNGVIKATAGSLTASSRVRVLPPGSFRDDFESLAVDATPSYMMHAIGMFKVAEEEGNRYLVKNRAPREIHRHHSFIGPPELRGATIQVDVRGTKTGEVVPDMGIATNGYTLDFLGAHQQLQIKDWHSALRIEKQVPMAWEPMTWYTMKLAVEHRDNQAFVRGKVWPRGTPEPETWSIEVVDPLPIPFGAPALFGNSETPIHFDNLEVLAQ